MFKNFLSYFNENLDLTYSDNPFRDFVLQLGGKTFGNGLFRSFSKENLEAWTGNVNEAYPEFEGKFILFGYDWLGRCFGIDLRKKSRGNVLMFEIGAAEIFEIPCSFLEFLNEEIPEYSDECLAEEYFHQWTESSGKTLEYGRCAGYRIPLFLGGEDALDNLEDSDMDVYWSVLTQVKNTM